MYIKLHMCAYYFHAHMDTHFHITFLSIFIFIFVFYFKDRKTKNNGEFPSCDSVTEYLGWCQQLKPYRVSRGWQEPAARADCGCFPRCRPKATKQRPKADTLAWNAGVLRGSYTTATNTSPKYFLSIVFFSQETLQPCLLVSPLRKHMMLEVLSANVTRENQQL